MCSRILVSFLTILLMLVVARSTTAQFYVDSVNGTDVVGAGSPTAPYQTINYAIANTVGFAVFKLRDGVYAENVVIDRDLRIEGTGQAAIISPPNMTMPAVRITDSVNVITPLTRVKNLQIQNAGVGIRVEGVAQGLGVSPEITNVSFSFFTRAIDVDVQNGLISNEIGVHFCSASGASLPSPGSRGVTGRCSSGIVVLNIDSCTVSAVETGIEFIGDTGNFQAVINNILIFNCERGINVEGTLGPVVQVRFATIADDIPVGASNTSAIRVAPTSTGFVSLENSILSLNQPTGDPLEYPFSTSIYVSHIASTDPLDVGLNSATNLLITPGSPFVGGSAPYHLGLGSVAIDKGDPALYVPSPILEEIPADRLGAPRFIDGTRSGILAPDMGAFEYTPVALDVTPGFAPPPATPNSTSPFENVVVGTRFTLHGTSNYPSSTPDFALVSIDFANDTNEFFSGAEAAYAAMGNVLVEPASTATMPLSGSGAAGYTGSLDLMAPGAGFAGFEFDFQIGFFSTSTAVAGPGNMSRRVRVEFTN